MEKSKCGSQNIAFQSTVVHVRSNLSLTAKIQFRSLSFMDIEQFCQWETHQSRWCRRGRVMKLLVVCLQWTWSFKNHLYFKWVASLSRISWIYLLRNVTVRDSKISLKFFVIEFFFFGFTTCAICDEIFIKFYRFVCLKNIKDWCER